MGVDFVGVDLVGMNWLNVLTESMYNLFPENALSLHFHTGRWPVACAWTLVMCWLIWYALKVNNFTPKLHCCFVGGASDLACPAIRSMCKSFRACTAKNTWLK